MKTKLKQNMHVTIRLGRHVLMPTTKGGREEALEKDVE